MKYFLKVILVLALAAATVMGMYYYTTGNRPTFLGGNSDYQLTTVSRQPVTEKYAALTLLVAEGDYALYKSGDLIVLDHAGKRYEFSGWSKDIDMEKPEMTVINIDDDPEDELIVKGVAAFDEESNDYIYSVYIMNSVEDAAKGYEVAILNEDAWKNLASKYIISEITQLKTSKKIVQLAMIANTTGSALAYDNATGIAIDAHTGYFRALQSDDGQYLTAAVWNMGKGIYSVSEDGTVSVDIDVDVSYDNTSEVQQAGVLRFDIALTSNVEYTIASKSILFTPNKSYAVAEPKLETAAGWSYTENLTTAATPAKEIKWIKHTLQYDAEAVTQTVDTAEELGDLSGVESLTMTESGITLKARKGSTFSEATAKSTQFSVIINKGTDSQYDIAYTCTLNEAKDTLTVTFDRTYARSEINAVEINFGTK